jgi:hypothetical protein
MAEKLRSLLTEKTLWRLLLKTLFGLFAVFLVYDSGFSPLWIFFAVVVFGVIYFREIEERRSFTKSFWALPVLALAAMEWVTAWSLTAFAVLFFILLGLINLFFKERHLIYGVFNTALILSISILFFFLARGPENFWILGIAFTALQFLVLKEALGFSGFPGSRRAALHAGVLAFIALEFAYILQFLPLGFINSAIFTTLFLVLGRETAVSFSKGALNFPFMMRQVTFFVVLTIIIFSASSW